MPDRFVPKGLLSRLGRRGAALALFGLVWVLQGLLVWGETLTSPAVGVSEVPHENLPFPFHGLIWAVCGAVGVVVGFRRTVRDHVGWLAVSLPPLMATASFFVAGVTAALPGDRGSVLGLPTAVGWGVVSLLISVLAGWPEPPAEIEKETVT